jgi:dTDP-L-rhamnose 4-epimerase
MRQILITGGAGFIGSHLADSFLNDGYKVRVLDNLSPQVHNDGKIPSYLNPEVEFIHGDIRNPEVVKNAVRGMDAVYHFAAKVGVGQSMYEVFEYTDVNNSGTAVLLEALIANPVERLVVASSMSIYGEGLYKCGEQIIAGKERDFERLKNHKWELSHNNGGELVPIPTAENKEPNLPSIYALSKFVQERMCLMIGRAYGIPVVALRFFNVYGTRQALSNPYTGVLAIFSSRLLNNRPPLINEDGYQRRDFVSVHDIVQACRLALTKAGAVHHAFNIGSGENYTIREIATLIARVLGKENIEPEITGRYRIGDIRNCFADISLARKMLGYQPRVTLEQGLHELAEWLSDQVATDRVPEATEELIQRGLSI